MHGFCPIGTGADGARTEQEWEGAKARQKHRNRALCLGTGLAATLRVGLILSPMIRAALTGCPTEQLKRLLKAIHRDVVTFPISRSNLIATAFGDFEEHLDIVIALDKEPATRVIVAVIAEREMYLKRTAAAQRRPK